MSLTRHVSVPASGVLSTVIESTQITHYPGSEAVAISVIPAGVPGLLLHVSDGRGASSTSSPSLRAHRARFLCFIYGPGTQPSVMTFRRGPFTTVQVVFQPHALKTLFGLNAAALTNGWAELAEFGADGLTDQLIEAASDQERIRLLTSFLAGKLKQEQSRDLLVEEGLRLIGGAPGGPR